MVHSIEPLVPPEVRRSGWEGHILNSVGLGVRISEAKSNLRPKREKRSK